MLLKTFAKRFKKSPAGKALHACLQSRIEVNKELLGVQRAALFSVDDYDKICDYNKGVNLYKWIGDNDKAFELTDTLNKFIESRSNDHHPNLLHKTRIEAMDGIVGHNKVTSAGVVGMVLILSQTSQEYFIYVSMGLGITPEAIGQKKLQDEKIRVSVETDGSQAGRGNIWNHVGTMGYGAITGKYTEFGIHNKPIEPSRMLARSMIIEGVDHVQNDTFIAASHSMIFEIK